MKKIARIEMTCKALLRAERFYSVALLIIAVKIGMIRPHVRMPKIPYVLFRLTQSTGIPHGQIETESSNHEDGRI